MSKNKYYKKPKFGIKKRHNLHGQFSPFQFRILVLNWKRDCEFRIVAGNVCHSCGPLNRTLSVPLLTDLTLGWKNRYLAVYTAKWYFLIWLGPRQNWASVVSIIHWLERCYSKVNEPRLKCSHQLENRLVDIKVISNALGLSRKPSEWRTLSWTKGLRMKSSPIKEGVFFTPFHLLVGSGQLSDHLETGGRRPSAAKFFNRAFRCATSLEICARCWNQFKVSLFR